MSVNHDLEEENEEDFEILNDSCDGTDSTAQTGAVEIKSSTIFAPHFGASQVIIVREQRVKDEEASLLVTQKEIDKLEKGYGVTKVKEKDNTIHIIDLLAEDSSSDDSDGADFDNDAKKR